MNPRAVRGVVAKFRYRSDPMVRVPGARNSLIRGAAVLGWRPLTGASSDACGQFAPSLLRVEAPVRDPDYAIAA